MGATALPDPKQAAQAAGDRAPAEDSHTGQYLKKILSI